MEHLKLSDGEWKLMKMLWAGQPQTLAELVTALDADTGWSRATIFMMLKRLIAKGTVEDKILKLHSTKKSLADALLEGSEMSSRLGREEIMELLELARS